MMHPVVRPTPTTLRLSLLSAHQHSPLAVSAFALARTTRKIQGGTVVKPLISLRSPLTNSILFYFLLLQGFKDMIDGAIDCCYFFIVVGVFTLARTNTGRYRTGRWWVFDGGHHQSYVHRFHSNLPRHKNMIQSFCRKYTPQR